ncbi:MAG: type II toxin-antitoxin system PemK/MazF family toxin [bacterium]
MPEPVRGDVWLADLNPTRGREQAGQRPVLVFSVDEFNRGPAELLVVLPITSTIRPIPLHMIVQPPEGGLKVENRILIDAIRSISRERLVAAKMAAGNRDEVVLLLRHALGHQGANDERIS